VNASDVSNVLVLVLETKSLTLSSHFFVNKSVRRVLQQGTSQSLVQRFPASISRLLRV